MTDKYYLVKLHFENPYLSGWKLFGTWKFFDENQAFLFAEQLKLGKTADRACVEVYRVVGQPKETLITSAIINK